jgi:hypothetical protein
MKKKNLKALISFGTCLLALGVGSLANADKVSNPIQVQPAVEKDANLGYFKRTNNGQNQELKVRIDNPSERKVTVQADVNNALGSPNGGTEYVPDNKTKHSSLIDQKHDMRKYLNGPKMVTVAPNDSQIVTYTLHGQTMPEGAYLGGISFIDKSQTVEQKTKQKRMTVYAQTRRLLSVQVMKGTPAPAKLAFNGATVAYDANMPYISLRMQNNTNNLAQHIALGYKLENAKHQVIATQKVNHDQRWLMNSKTKLGHLMPWNAKKFKPGKYYLTVDGEADHKTVHYQTSFTVSNKTVKNYAKASHIKPEVQSYGLVMLIISLVFFVAAIAILIYTKKRGRKTIDE